MLRPIKTERQYESALAKAYRWIQRDFPTGSKELDELEILTILISKYEDKHYPIPPPHPLDAIKFRLEQLGLSHTELSAILGTEAAPQRSSQASVSSRSR